MLCATEAGEVLSIMLRTGKVGPTRLRTTSKCSTPLLAQLPAAVVGGVTVARQPPGTPWSPRLRAPGPFVMPVLRLAAADRSVTPLGVQRQLPGYKRSQGIHGRCSRQG